MAWEALEAEVTRRSSRGAAAPAGPGDGVCPFCEAEAEAGDGDGGGGNCDGDGDASAAAARSPFAARRAMWRLLQKLRPAAAAWWREHAALCPHSGDAFVWRAVADALAQQLVPLPAGERALTVGYIGGEARALRRRYALAIERAFSEVRWRGAAWRGAGSSGVS